MLTNKEFFLLRDRIRKKNSIPNVYNEYIYPSFIQIPYLCYYVD